MQFLYLTISLFQYTSLVWESNILLALCSEDALPAGCEFGKADMDKLLPQNSQNNTQSSSSKANNAETEETFSPSSGTSADSSSSVTVAMENLSTDPDLASGAMEVDEKDKEAKKPDSNLHHQIKQIKPLLGNIQRHVDPKN